MPHCGNSNPGLGAEDGTERRTAGGTYRCALFWGMQKLNSGVNEQYLSFLRIGKYFLTFEGAVDIKARQFGIYPHIVRIAVAQLGIYIGAGSFYPSRFKTRYLLHVVLSKIPNLKHGNP